MEAPGAEVPLGGPSKSAGPKAVEDDGYTDTRRSCCSPGHTFLSVFHDRMIDVQVAAYKEADCRFLPPADTLPGKLLLRCAATQSERSSVKKGQ